ncbi:MAG: hypothetical protein HY514_03835 [Candidatus Aenigmarchaeota archaeon]|nr:hypothetical protein [Candidatus Aenigmarchaeota archaeon]
MDAVYRKIRELEKELERVKSQFHLGKASLEFSKKRVLQLEKELSRLIRKLPEHERDIYLLRKEFGKEF